MVTAEETRGDLEINPSLGWENHGKNPTFTQGSLVVTTMAKMPMFPWVKFGKTLVTLWNLAKVTLETAQCSLCCICGSLENSHKKRISPTTIKLHVQQGFHRSLAHTCLLFGTLNTVRGTVTSFEMETLTYDIALLPKRISIRHGLTEVGRYFPWLFQAFHVKF